MHPCAARIFATKAQQERARIAGSLPSTVASESLPILQSGASTNQ